MTPSKENMDREFLISALIVLLLVSITSSSAVPKADSPADRNAVSRQERSVPFPRYDQQGSLRDRLTRFHPVEPEYLWSPGGRPQRRPIPTQRKQLPSNGDTRAGGTSSTCPCDQSRLSRVDEQIARLVDKTDELTKQSMESRSNIRSMMATNRQLQSQMSQVMREKQTLETETHTLQTRASSLTQDNQRLREENERLTVELLQASADSEDDEAAAEAVAITRGSPLRELGDVVGNREAELVEMGLPVRVGAPQRGPVGRQGPSGAQRFVPESRPDLDAENLASSLLAVNTEIRDMTRKVEQLERKVSEQQREVVQGGKARPQFRQVPFQHEPDVVEESEVSEKITQLERLILIALRSRPGERLASQGAAPRSEPLMGERGQMRRQQGAAAMESHPFLDAEVETGPPSAERLTIADTLSDEDLDAMANVVESVQNKSPRKSAFSVASTGITLGADGDPLAIQFDHEFVNKGGDFKMRQNRFICEHPGFYFITFTVRSYDGKYLGVTLMKNDELQTAIYADSSDRNVMQSQSVIVHLEPGDGLWLRIAPSGNFAVHSGVHRYLTFSGFLVYRGF